MGCDIVLCKTNEFQMLTVPYFLEIKSCFSLYAYFYKGVTVYSCRLEVPRKSKTLATISCFGVVLNIHSENSSSSICHSWDMCSTLQRNTLIAFDMDIKPTNEYKHLRESYIMLHIVCLLYVRVSATLVAILREDSTKYILQKL